MLSTHSGPWQLWTLVSRSVRPTYGARANAADGLREVRRVAREHAEQAASTRPVLPQDRP